MNKCIDCEILAGPGFLVRRFDSVGRCPSCAEHLLKYGAVTTSERRRGGRWCD